MKHVSGVEIATMAFGGAGLARVDGKVIFVTGALEGDVVDVSLTSDKKTYAKGEVQRLVTPSPLRRTPPCAHAQACGGCPFIAGDDAAQRRWKKEFVLSSLVKVAGMNPDTLDALAGDVIHDQPLGYRHRVTLKVGVIRGRIALGFLSAQSGRDSANIAPITSCPVATPAVNGVIQQLHAALAAGKDVKPGPVFDLELQEVHAADGAAKVLATISGGRKFQRYSLDQLLRQFPYLTQVADALRACSELAWLGSPRDSQKAEPYVFDREGDLEYLTFPSLFQQAHLAINRKMRAVVHEALVNCESVLDLFCGSGNLSLGLSPTQSVTGVEAHPLSIKAAKRAAERGGLKSSHRYRTATAEAFLKDAKPHVFDGVVSDPPRAGHGKTITQLLKLAPQVLVLVGCDPMNLARDVAACTDSGYHLRDLHVFDAFPQTYHVEAIAVLQRNEP